MEPNNHLDGADRLLEGRVYGPECLIARKNDIYMGIHGGEVIKMNAGHITHVTKIGQPCGKSINNFMFYFFMLYFTIKTIPFINIRGYH